MSSSWTPQPRFRGVVTHCRYSVQSAAFALCFLLLAGCGQSSTPTASAPAPAAGGNTIPAISAPPGAGERPAPLGSTGTQKDADGLPVLAPRGVNAGQLFAQKLSNTDDRLNRLENAVQEMRNDFDAMAPAIVRLVAVEKDIQELVTQLETLVAGDRVPTVESRGLMPDSAIEFPQEYPVSTPASHETGIGAADGAPLPLSDELPAQPENPPAVAAVVTTPPPAAPPAPAATTSGVAVTALRIGEHPGKTRLVLDVSGKTAFTADLDNAEKILVVDLSAAGWNAEAKKTFTSSPLVASYEVNSGANGAGSLLVVKLKSDAAILYKGAMPGDGGKGSKIVIDLGRAGGASVPTN